MDLGTSPQVSFRAHLGTDFVVKNAKKFRSIAKQFAEETKEYPHDRIVISKDKFDTGKFDINVTNDLDYGKKSRYNGLLSNTLVIDDFDKMLETENEGSIIKKFVSIIKMVRKEAEYDSYGKAMDKKIEEAKYAEQQYKRTADIHSEEFAQRHFKKTAESCKEKIDRLIERKFKHQDKLLKDMKKIAGDDPELGIVPRIHDDMDKNFFYDELLR